MRMCGYDSKNGVLQALMGVIEKTLEPFCLLASQFSEGLCGVSSAAAAAG